MCCVLVDLKTRYYSFGRLNVFKNTIFALKYFVDIKKLLLIIKLFPETLTLNFYIAEDIRIGGYVYKLELGNSVLSKNAIKSV